MLVRRAPFLISFIVCFLPMLGATLKTDTFHLPVFLVFVFFLAFNFSNKKDVFLKFNKLQLWVIVCMFSVLALQLVTKRGFVVVAGGGYVALISFFFSYMFSLGKPLSIEEIINGINKIYKLLIVFLVIELVIVLLGGQHLLGELFWTPKGPVFKTYNQADVFRALGFFQDTGGLNSIFFGSQIAGMISLFSMIWFVGLRMLPALGVEKKKNTFWLALSVFLFICTTNGTTTLLLIITIFLFVFKINKKNKFFFLSIFLILSVGLFFLIKNPIMFDRFLSNDASVTLHEDEFIYHDVVGSLGGGTMKSRDYYIAIFFLPVFLILKLDLVNILLGVGAEAFFANYWFVTGDNGYFTDVIFKSGLIWTICFTYYIFKVCLPNIGIAYKNNTYEVWSVMGSINSLIALLWFFSTIHFNQAMGNPGGVTLFALHVSLTLYCYNKKTTFSPDHVRILTGTVVDSHCE